MIIVKKCCSNFFSQELELDPRLQVGLKRFLTPPFFNSHMSFNSIIERILSFMSFIKFLLIKSYGMWLKISRNPNINRNHFFGQIQN